MMKVGKYEKMRKRALMRTYITSLVCLALCVTMFLGTTMAWFSDTVASPQNQMYVGTLEIDLHHATFSDGSIVNGTNADGGYSKVDGDYKVLKDTIKWEPGYTAVEKFRLTENGDLAFGYLMNIDCAFTPYTITKDGATINVTQEAQEAIAKAITVWNYVGSNAAGVTELPENFDVMSGSADWEKVGTLYEAITNKLPVFKGSMDKGTVNAEASGVAYHVVAFHMDETFDGAVTKDNEGKITDSVQGKTLKDITISVVATQLPSETDAFGSTYDEVIPVGTADELATELANGGKIKLIDDIELDSTLMATKDVVIDLNGNEMTVPAYSSAIFQSQSNASPDITITSSTPGAAINVAGGDTSVLLGYGSTVIENVTINVTGCDNASPNPFNVYGDLTLGEGTVVNVDYLGTALISNNGAANIVIDGAKINIDEFKTNGTAIITLNNASTLTMKNTEIKVEEFVLSSFGGDSLVSKVDGVTIENCTFDVTDSNGASCTFEAKEGKYRLVQITP